MSTAPRSRPQPNDDPTPEEFEARFPYGSREVWDWGPDGGRELTQIPLTQHDVLHPQEGDHILNGDDHGVDVRYLTDAFKVQLSDDPTAEVFSDVPVYWGDQLGHHSPDVTVVFGARPRRVRLRNSFIVSRERVRPQLLVEVTSRSTRNADLGDKRRAYYQAQVPFYVIVDELPDPNPEENPRRIRLLGYRRGARGYVRLPLNNGRLWLETVRLWLAIENGHVVCYDAAGRRIPSIIEARQQLQATEGRLQASEQRARELEAELRRLRGER